jgi:hypothetical protein
MAVWVEAGRILRDGNNCRIPGKARTGNPRRRPQVSPPFLSTPTSTRAPAGHDEKALIGAALAVRSERPDYAPELCR